MGSVAASENSAAPKAAWICLVLAWICFLIPFPGLGLFLGWPLNLVAFILAIIGMSKKGAMAGIFQLVASLIASPIIYFIGLAIFAGSMGAIAEASKPAGTSSQAVISPASEDSKAGDNNQVPVIPVDSRVLFKDYEANEIAADQKYKGKRLLVTGEIQSIDSGITDEPVISLSTGSFLSVQLRGISADSAASLSKGQSITVECTGAGEVIGSPMLEDCSY